MKACPSIQWSLAEVLNHLCNLLASPDLFLKVGSPISPGASMTGSYQYVDLLAKNMEISLMPGQYLGVTGAPLAYK